MKTTDEAAVALLRAAKELTQVMIDEQSMAALLTIQRAVGAGSGIALEVLYPPDGALPRVQLLVVSPDGARQAISGIEAQPSSLQ